MPLFATRQPGTAFAAEQPNPIVSRRLFFENPERSSLRISPKATKLAWLAPLDGALNLWVSPVDDLRQARPVTRATRAIWSNFVWAWNDQHIVFFRDQGGDENSRAASVDVETEVTVPLTPERGVIASLLRRSPLWPTEMLFTHNARDKSFFDLYLIDIVSGRGSLVFENHEFDALYADAAFNLRFGKRPRRDGSAEIMQRKEDSSWVSFAEVPLEDEVTTWLASYPPDRRSLYLVDSRGRDKGALFEIDVKTGSRKLLVEDSEADISSVLLHPNSERPIAASARAAKNRWHIVDESFREDFLALENSAGRGEIAFNGISSEAQRFAVFIDRDDASGEFILHERGGKKGELLFRTRPKLNDVNLRPMMPVSIPARDGLVLPGYLTLPRDDLGNGPLILVVHGGPYSRDTWGYNSTHQWLANRGYAVLSVNFRGSTGFGKAFYNAAEREWGGRMHDDLIDGVEWAISKGYADRARIGIMGASYGGYAALIAATKTPKVFACIVDIFGISNLITFLETIPPHWGPSIAADYRRLADPRTEEGRAWLRERSPLTHVDRIVRPLLIGQGMNDVRVVPAESEQIVRAMERLGIPVTYVTFPDEGHGWSRPGNRLAFNAIVEQFLSKHLGGRAEPIGDAFVGSSARIEAGRELIPGLS
jgi:dipeptidyl aminopeptidase/acylaminoacyl peptidase